MQLLNTVYVSCINKWGVDTFTHAAMSANVFEQMAEFASTPGAFDKKKKAKQTDIKEESTETQWQATKRIEKEVKKRETEREKAETQRKKQRTQCSRRYPAKISAAAHQKPFCKPYLTNRKFEALRLLTGEHLETPESWVEFGKHLHDLYVDDALTSGELIAYREWDRFKDKADKFEP